DARDRLVRGHVDPPAPQPLGERGEVVDDEAGMGLARRRERLLHADVQLLRARTEPAAAPRSQRRRLLQLLEPEQRDVEAPSLRLAATRRCDLDVVDAEDGHRTRVYHRPVAPGLEDTLVSGFTRLASDAPHRRIDAE